MHPTDIARQRLQNLRLSGLKFAAAEEAVHWLGAVQSQDYGPAKWSIGERTDGVGDAAIDRAYVAGTILRTHVLRPTWHFVTPADIRWLLKLTGPRVHVQNAYMYRQLGLDDAVREHCTALVAAALNGGNHLTRKELAAVLQSAGIAAEGFRLAYILMSAELDGVICSGPPRGRQHTYALLDERVPETAGPTGDAALAELILRYFASHGPATVKDLRWWSSLTMADITTGIEMVGSQLEREIVDGVPYWSVPQAPPPGITSPRVHLLQGYDEYLMGYSESKYVSVGRQLSLPPGTKIPNGVMIVDTQLAGHWKRTVRSRSVTFEVALYEPFDDHQMTALHAAADAHAAFLDLTAVVEVSMLPTT
jgi:Winged helix DNA-binding domain